MTKQQQRYYIIFIFPLLVLGLVLILPNISLAAEPQQGAEAVSRTCGWTELSCLIPLAISWVLAALIGMIGFFITALAGILVWIGKYNGFITSTPVVMGWSVVRDISNMFFVLVLLIISFGTILHVQQYQMKSLLPKVILMAILVNFSKAIAGIFIDFAQVIMLTFVAAYQNAGAGNILSGLKIDSIYQIAPADTSIPGIGTTPSAINNFQIVIGYLLGLLFALAALVVVIAMVLIFFVRIVMLWILVIFSPLAYVLSVVPAGQKYAQQWWDTFSKYVIIGPVLAFFLWLSLASIPQINEDPKFKPNAADIQAGAVNPNQQPQIPGVGPTVIGAPEQMVGFIVSISMLIMSLVFAQQVGGAVGRIAGNAYGRITTAGSRMAMWPIRSAQNMALGAATSDMVMNRLSGLSRVPVVGRFATRAYSSLRGPQQRLEDDAEREVKRANHLEVLRAWANNVAVSPYARARKAAARKRAPNTIYDDSEFMEHYRRMSKADIRALPDSELFRTVSRLGMGRLDQNSSFHSILTDPGSTEERGIVQEALGALPAWIPAVTAVGHPMPAPTPYRIPGNINTRYRATDVVDTLKLATTQQKIKDTGGDAKKFFTSDEYKNNRDQYLGEEEYTEHQRGEATQRLQPAGGAGTLQAGTVLVQGEQVHVGGAMAMPFPKNSLDKVSGAQSLLARGARDGYARMAVDFKKLQDVGLREDVHGANIGAQDKQRVVGGLDKGTGKWSGIMGELQKEGKYSDRELQQIHRDLTNAKGLTLLNKGAGDARGTIAHEAIHDRLNTVDPNELRNMWNSLSDSQKDDAKNEIQKQWGNNLKSPLNNDEVVHEYFAEGLTKASQYGGKSNVKIELPQSILDRFAALGVVTKKAVTAGKGDERTERTVYNPTNLFRKKAPVAEAAVAPAPEKATALHEELEEEAPDVAYEMEEEPREAADISREPVRGAAAGIPETPALSRSLFGMDPMMRKAFRDLTFQMHELAKSQRISALRVDELTGHIGKLANRTVSERPDNPLAVKAHDEEILSELKKIEGSLGGGDNKLANDKSARQEAA